MSMTFSLFEWVKENLDTLLGNLSFVHYKYVNVYKDFEKNVDGKVRGFYF
jgi:hypothetical protein